MISSGIALLYSMFGSLLPSAGIVTSATRPGITVMAGMKIFGNAPISGVRCAALRLLADSARWTSAKFVVQ